MPILSAIIFTFIFVDWFILRILMRKWKSHPLSMAHSAFAGILSWLLLISLIIWFGIILSTLWKILFSYAVKELILLVVNSIVTGIIIMIFIPYKYELQIDDMWDFIRESLLFRRSAQKKIDLFNTIETTRKRRAIKYRSGVEAVEREALRSELNKEKEIERHISFLKQGTTVDISDLWKLQSKTHAEQSIYTKINEVKIEPYQKRIRMIADFPDLKRDKLKDEMYILKFNRDVYDFLQSLRYEGWLKKYWQFFETFYLICRILKTNEEGTDIYYPFMKVVMSVSTLVELEGKYFNPRKLGEVADIVFKDGNPV